MEKARSTFHTFHDYLNFYGEKKDDRLFTIYDINCIIVSINALYLKGAWKIYERNNERNYRLYC